MPLEKQKLFATEGQAGLLKQVIQVAHICWIQDKKN